MTVADPFMEVENGVPVRGLVTRVYDNMFYIVDWGKDRGCTEHLWHDMKRMLTLVIVLTYPVPSFRLTGFFVLCLAF
jgi:hypothetical protein